MNAASRLIPIFPDIPMKVKTHKKEDIFLAYIPVLKDHQHYVKIRGG